MKKNEALKRRYVVQEVGKAWNKGQHVGAPQCREGKVFES